MNIVINKCIKRDNWGCVRFHMQKDDSGLPDNLDPIDVYLTQRLRRTHHRGIETWRHDTSQTIRPTDEG